MLPLLGPLLGLCVFVPYFDLTFEEGNVIQPNSPCFGPDPEICPTSFKFDYFFWNITNAEQVRCAPPLISLQTFFMHRYSASHYFTIQSM